MKPRVYLETSVLSYIASRGSRDPVAQFRQDVTKRWWQQERAKYDLVVSETVEAECMSGDPQQVAQRMVLLQEVMLLTADPVILELAKELTVPGAFPPKAGPDAIHVAAAVVHRCDYLLTWNLRHIANAHIRRVVERIVEAKGYAKPTICTPEELF
jgi:predicted nucleic acid-binding protein